MHRIKIMGLAFVAVLSIAGVAAGSASAKQLVLSEASVGTLAPGEIIEVHFAFSFDDFFAAEYGPTTCERVYPATVTANGRSIDTITAGSEEREYERHGCTGGGVYFPGDQQPFNPEITVAADGHSGRAHVHNDFDFAVNGEGLFCEYRATLRESNSVSGPLQMNVHGVDSTSYAKEGCKKREQITSSTFVAYGPDGGEVEANIAP
jgi:hypothetical protein